MGSANSVPLGCFPPSRARVAGALLAKAAVALSAALVSVQPAWLVASCALGWCLLALAWIDIREQRLPDRLTLPLLLAGLAESLLLAPESLVERTIGVIAGYCAFRLLALGYARLRGRAGLGEGDAKLLAAAGAWVGWTALPALVLIAAILALTFVLAAGFLSATNNSSAQLPTSGAGEGPMRTMRRRFDPSRRISFGPFLAGATWLIWLLAAIS